MPTTQVLPSFALDLLGGTWAISGTGTKLSAQPGASFVMVRGTPKAGCPNWSDFDSAIPWFESRRPQPKNQNVTQPGPNWPLWSVAPPPHSGHIMNPIPRKGYHAETWWHTVLTNEYGPRQIVVGQTAGPFSEISGGCTSAFDGDESCGSRGCCRRVSRPLGADWPLQRRTWKSN